MHVSSNNIDLSNFKKVTSNMISLNGDLLDGWKSKNTKEVVLYENYTSEEIKRIVKEGSTEERQLLSRVFFYKDGLYSRVLLHYATLLKYIGVLVPKVKYNGKIRSKTNKKKYFEASRFCDLSNFAKIFINCSLKVLIDGRYYGFIHYNEDGVLNLVDLPYNYCRTRYRDLDGNDLVEFDLRYFDTIIDEDDRDEALRYYPKEISSAYKKLKKRKSGDPWILLDSSLVVTFAFLESPSPILLNMIPASLQYDDAVDTERERDKEEIKKILVQKIPHNNQNEFLLEPDEVEELHRGAVGMLKSNENIKILTTYADVDAIVSKTSNDSNTSTLQQMLRNVYSKAGVSGQLFASDSNSAINITLENDTAFMMILANQYSQLITKILNSKYGSKGITFKYQFLPITYHNDSDYLDTALKLGNNGYSFILPSLAMGITQGDLIDIKDLENDLLELQNKLIPLSNSYTQSGKSEGEPGAPTLNPEDKADQTIKNEAVQSKQKD